MQPNGPGRFPPQQSMTGPMRGPGPQGMMPPQPQMGRPGPPGGPQQGPRPGQGYKSAQSQRAPEPSGPTITPNTLASAGPAEQKQMLGEALYPRIHESVPALAGVSGLLVFS
jgi:polyadenylate-binding protein